MGWAPKALTSREHIKDRIRAGEQGRWPGVVALAGQLGEAVPGQGRLSLVGGDASCPAGPTSQVWMCFESLALGKGQKHHVLGRWALGLTEGAERPGSRQLTLPRQSPVRTGWDSAPGASAPVSPPAAAPVWLLGVPAFSPTFLFLS